MSLQEVAKRVLALQHYYSSANTEQMSERGKLIRTTFPDAISSFSETLTSVMGLKPGDLLIEGRDGVGLKSEIPWVRFSSRLSSPSATAGWYVVWLYRRDGQGAYLTLAHGSTTLQGGTLIARSDQKLAELMTWGRTALGEDLDANPKLIKEIDLATKAPLAVAYEKSSLASFYYPASSIPDDEILEQDMLAMAALLSKIYKAESLGKTPLSPNPEVVELKQAISAIAEPSSKKNNQGFGLTAPQRKAVELRAMGVAIEHLKKLGFTLIDVSTKESFDLIANRGSERLTVEVKGTTGQLGSIVLTANEVMHHQQAFPNNALVVVYDIDLIEIAGKPFAQGGKLLEHRPWALEKSRLKGLAFTYDLA